MNNLSPEWAMVIVTAVYAIFTLLMMGATAWMAWETRIARKLQQEPQIDAYIQRGDDCNAKLYLVVKNNGQGGAYNIKLKLKEDFETLKEAKIEEYRKLSYQGPFKNGISFLPPGGQRAMLLRIPMGEEFTQLLKQTIDLTVEYMNSTGNRKSGKFELSFSELENTLLLPENPLYEISKNLEKISKKIDGFASGFYQLKTITQTKKEFDEEKRRILDQVKKAKIISHGSGVSTAKTTTY